MNIPFSQTIVRNFTQGALHTINIRGEEDAGGNIIIRSIQGEYSVPGFPRDNYEIPPVLLSQITLNTTMSQMLTGIQTYVRDQMILKLQ